LKWAAAVEAFGKTSSGKQRENCTHHGTESVQSNRQNLASADRTQKLGMIQVPNIIDPIHESHLVRLGKMG
jgi:hypothetical protein